MEHTTLHLLYSRFWAKFLYDIDVVPYKEPYLKRTSHGMILGENGEKMSKSRGNVVNPDDIVRDYGADTMRLYEMFIGDFEQSAPWNTQSIKGCKRFLERFYNIIELVTEADVPELDKHVHKLIKKVSDDIDSMKFNTAIAALMSVVNVVYERGAIGKAQFSIMTKLLSPFAPHLAEEIYSALGNGELVSLARWPEYDAAKAADDTLEIPVQINGRVRSVVTVSATADKDEVLKAAKSDEKVAAALEGATIVKEIVVPKKIVNIVIK